MRFDIQKLDERIKKLQEIRRLATDPEMATILLEFLSPENGREYAAPEPVVAQVKSDKTDHLINEVVNGVEAPAGGSLWYRKDR